MWTSPKPLRSASRMVHARCDDSHDATCFAQGISFENFPNSWLPSNIIADKVAGKMAKIKKAGVIVRSRRARRPLCSFVFVFQDTRVPKPMPYFDMAAFAPSWATEARGFRNEHAACAPMLPVSRHLRRLERAATVKARLVRQRPEQSLTWSSGWPPLSVSRS